MGSAAGKDRSDLARRSKIIDDSLKQDADKNLNIVKLLLLGAAEGGKSTILKQMRVIHGGGFDELEASMQKEWIYHNTFEAALCVFDAMKLFQLDLNEQQLIDRFTISEAYNVKNSCSDLHVVLNGYFALKRLLKDDDFLNCFNKSNEFYLPDSARYFFAHLDRLFDECYVPNQQDMIHTRIATTGIVEINLTIRAVNFRIIDVGGQRSERRKWIHCFNDVHAVIFVASLAEYNLILAEDNFTNRMKESIILFETIYNCIWLKNSSMLLFLNKKDLFEEKIGKVPLKISFPEYQGPDVYSSAVAFIRSKFVELKTEKTSTLYIHETCATDTTSIKFVFDACIDTILQNSISDMNLL